MKKFSTAALVTTLLLAGALQPVPAGAADCAFRTDAPDQHQVKRGDTRWGIAGRFLTAPWCWPQVWGVNRAQIRNPHWIYPGQVVYLDRAAGRLRLGTLSSQDALPVVRLSPRIRAEQLGAEAIPTIPASAIEPFLLQPLVVEAQALEALPRIIATQEGRVFLSRGDKAYVRGSLEGQARFPLLRPGEPLIDPASREVLGHEATYLGMLHLDRAAAASDEAHRFIVAQAREEMGVGDRLLALPPEPITNFHPHAPASPVSAQVMALHGGLSQAGQNQVVILNRGRQHGLEAGSVLQLRRSATLMVDRTVARNDLQAAVRLPEEAYGSLLVFRSFERLSYALIMQVTDAVYIGDLAQTPE